MSPELSHIDEHGRAAMVNVTGKPLTLRRAETRATVRQALAGRPASERAALLTTARVAALEGAKATSSLIPLCHPLPLTDLLVEFFVDDDDVEVRAVAETVGQTGVEMEALTACATAALCLLAAAGPTRPGAMIEDLGLWDKSGGRSGHWRREEPDDG